MALRYAGGFGNVMTTSPQGPLRGPRNRQGFETVDDASWAHYVASWPWWRTLDRCGGTCPRARVCGRARVCLEAHVRERVLVAALARLSERLGEQAPARAEGKQSDQTDLWED